MPDLTRMPPLLIELIGPPGSGKTTIARRLSGILPEVAPACLSFEALERLNLSIGMKHILRLGPLDRTRQLLPLLWQQPKLALSILLLALLHGPPYRRRLKKARRSLAHVRYALRLRALEDPSIVVLHEGFTQTLWSVLVDSRALRGRRLLRLALAEYAAAVGARGVRLRIDDERAKARAFERESRGRFNRHASAARRDQFGRWLGYHQELVALLPAGMVAATIDAAPPEDEVARALAGVVAGLAAKASQASPLRAPSAASEPPGSGRMRAPSGPSS